MSLYFLGGYEGEKEMLFKIGLSDGFLPNSFIPLFCIQNKNYNSRRLYSLLAPESVSDEQL